jgi:5-methylcytosine-specific restriction protein A
MNTRSRTCGAHEMRRHDQRRVAHAVSGVADRLDDGAPRLRVPGTYEVAHVLKHHVSGLLRARDLHDVEEERAARGVVHALLRAALRERLAGEARAKDVVVGDEACDLTGRAGRGLVIDVRARESADVVDQAVGRKLGEGARVDLAALAVEFAGHDAIAAKPVQGMVKAANSREEIDESETIHAKLGTCSGSLACGITVSIGSAIFKGSTRGTLMATAHTKQEIMNQACDLLSLPHFPVSRGSTEPRAFFDAVASAIGVDPSEYTNKQFLAEAIARRLGQDWDANCDSRDSAAAGGGTVTAEGLSRILNGLQQRGASEDQRFELRLGARMARTQLPRKQPTGADRPERVAGTTVSFKRSAEVAEWVLKHAKGVCEHCSAPAPFVTRDGTAYLEVHHVKPLADGGADTVENAVAVCPNCHRAAHYSKDSAAIGARLTDHIRSRRYQV